MNQGERDELLATITMLYLRSQHAGFAGVTRVDQVGNRTRLYRAWTPAIGAPSALRSVPPAQLAAIAKSLHIGKAPAGDKADVLINGIGYSLKSHRSAPPAIVNHTTRPGWEFACSHTRTRIEQLDAAVDAYWIRRKAGLIKEDVGNDDVNSPFRLLMPELTPLLSYFLFIGTGTRLSRSPASKVLDIVDPVEPRTWTVLSPEAVVPQIWSRLVFSLRSRKGMPSNYPAVSAKQAPKLPSVRRWTHYWQDQYRGALHVRLRNS